MMFVRNHGQQNETCVTARSLMIAKMIRLSSKTDMIIIRASGNAAIRLTTLSLNNQIWSNITSSHFMLGLAMAHD